MRKTVGTFSSVYLTYRMRDPTKRKRKRGYGGPRVSFPASTLLTPSFSKHTL